MIRLAALAAAGLLAAACTETVTLAPAGVYNASGYAFDLQRDWSHIPDGLDPSVTVDQLTVDGPQLNQVLLIEQLADGASLIVTAGADDPAPVFRTGMTELDVVEFLTDSLSALGLEDVAARNIRPAPFAGAAGVRFQFTARRANGLAVRGAAAASSAGDSLDGLVFLAPAEHYFSHYQGDVEAMFDTARRTAAES